VSSDARTGVPTGVACGVGSLPGTGSVEARRRPVLRTVTQKLYAPQMCTWMGEVSTSESSRTPMTFAMRAATASGFAKSSKECTRR